MQLTINHPSKWARENSFVLSTQKTSGSLFMRRRSTFAEPSLLVASHAVRIMYSLMTVNCHLFHVLITLKKMPEASKHSLDYFKDIVGCWWTHTVAHLGLRGTISNNYGSVGRVRGAYPKALDLLHHEGIWPATGAFRMSLSPEKLVQTDTFQANTCLTGVSLQQMSFYNLPSSYRT